MDEKYPELKEYRRGDVTIRTYKGEGIYQDYWLFNIQRDGEETIHHFCGLPNKCLSRREAHMRGWHRAGWLISGMFNGKYSVSLWKGEMEKKKVSIDVVSGYSNQTKERGGQDAKDSD